MAIGSVYLTKRGRNLLAKAVAGTNLTFTRFAIGDGYLNGAAIEDLNNVISFKYSVSISKKQFNEIGKVKLAGNFTNSDVGGFYYRELGLFATDPDLGEILYAYGNADTRAEYIPVSTEEIYEKTIVLNAYISNAASVTAVIDESLVFATVEDLNMVSDTVNSHVINNSNPHGVTPAQIGAVTPSEMGSAILAEKEDVKAWAKGTFSNPNLLINGYLKNAVNQMGLTMYQEITNTFYIPTVDMWWVSGGTVTIGSNGMSVTKYGSLEVVTIYHHSLLRHLAGETLTLSAKIDGVIRVVTGVLTETSQVCAFFPHGALWFYNPAGRVFTQTCINFTDDLTHVVEWVKLEEGDINTPCSATDKDELLKCLPYYEIIGKGAWVKAYSDYNCHMACSFRVRKRAVPTLTLLDTMPAFYGMNIDTNVVLSSVTSSGNVSDENGIGYMFINGSFATSSFVAGQMYGVANNLVAADARLY